MPTISAQKLKTPLSIVTALSAPSSKTPKESFQNTAVSLKDGKLKFRCDGSSGSGEVQIDVEHNPDEEYFATRYVNTQKLNAAIGVLGQEISITSTNNGIQLSNSKTSIQLRGSDFYESHEIGSEVSEWFPVNGKEIAKAISRTYGVFEDAMAITLSDKGIVWCTTSGNTLVVWTSGLGIPVTAKIPKESCRILAQALNSGECEIGKQDNLYVLRFKADGFHGILSLRVFDDHSNAAKFSYAFTQKPRRFISQVLKADILGALNACAVVQTAENTRVMMKSEGSQLIIKKAVTDYGAGDSVVPLQNMDPNKGINEQHCAQRLAKTISSAATDELGIDVCEIVLGENEGVEFTNLAFVVGNTVAVSMQIDLA